MIKPDALARLQAGFLVGSAVDVGLNAGTSLWTDGLKHHPALQPLVMELIALQVATTLIAVEDVVPAYAARLASPLTHEVGAAAASLRKRDIRNSEFRARVWERLSREAATALVTTRLGEYDMRESDEDALSVRVLQNSVGKVRRGLGRTGAVLQITSAQLITRKYALRLARERLVE